MDTLFGKPLGLNHPPIFVAEISCNHGGNIDEAKYLINSAYQMGADAVKIQVYTPDELTLKCDNEHFIIKEGPWKGRNLYNLYNKTQTPIQWVPELFRYAKELKIPLFSSVFGISGLLFLEQNDCPVYKIASFENNYDILIKDVMQTQKPMIISLGGIDGEAYEGPFGANIIHMHCVSKYPCGLEYANLSNIAKLYSNMCINVGFSDHTKGTRASEYAVLLGARVIEKHFTYLTTTEDATFSATPDEFKDLVRKCNEAFFAWEAQKPEQVLLKRSIFISGKIRKGETFTADNIKIIRPGIGLEPGLFHDVIGKVSTKDLEYGTPLKEDSVKW